MSIEQGPKLKQLENFLLNPDSDESKNYINDLLTKETARPEDLFVQKFLSVDFWKELGYSDNEIKIEETAGTKGRVEIALHVEGKRIAVECKRPYLVKKGEAVENELDGNDILELKDQISEYLISHSFVVFTNGFYWYFYSRESYSIWLRNKDNKNSKLNPYFNKFTAEQILDSKSHNYILNTLSRKNVLDSLSGLGDKSVRNSLTQDFFSDLKSWVGFIDTALKDTPADTKARTTHLINKLIFVRTMEGVGIIPNGFLAALWDNKKGVRNSTVNFIDHIDDELSEIYDTELFTDKYLVNEDGDPVLKDGLPQYNKERQRNYAYKALSEEFLSAILRPITASNFDEQGKTRIRFNNQEYYIRSLYWWRFEAISADILGKAYETYLAIERKKLGIYYTPHQITEYLTKKTVGELFENEFIALQNELHKEKWDIEKIKSIATKIRELKVCDPSCGSGSFLIQAIRIIWDYYKKFEELINETDKRIVQGKAVLDEYFTEKASVLLLLEILFRIKDRQEKMGTLILRHIFGNDKDIKAVDTAKLNIWLECLRLDPNSYQKDRLKGKRHVLPNLELNITVGDSLIGFGIEDTNNALTGLQDSLKSMFRLREDYVESFEKTSIAKAVVDLRNGLKGLVDHEFATKLGMKYSQDLLKILEPTHWSLQHFDAYYDKEGNQKTPERQGFDVIIGNPPWEILKPNIDEYFSILHNIDDNTKFRKLTKEEKNNFIEKQQKDPLISAQYDFYKKSINLQREYFAKTKIYKHQSAQTNSPKNVIDINLYKLFIEKYYSLLKKDGRAGIVLPASFLLDLGSKGLRHLLYNDNKIISLYDFDNRKGIFEEIHRQYRFITLVFQRGQHTTKFLSSFHIRDIEKITTLDDNAFEYDISLLAKTSPDTLALLEFRDQTDVNILKKLYNFPLLSEKVEPEWKIRFQREFHMTGDAHLFNTKRNGLPLYEGKMIHQFDNEFLEPRYWIEEEKGRKTLENFQLHRMKRESNKLEKKSKTEIKTTKIQIDFDSYRLGWRDVTNAVDYRTLIATIFPPKTFMGQTISYMRTNHFDGKKFQPALSSKETVFLLGMFNSLVVDYIIRHRVGLHATMSIVSEMPIPRLTEKDKYFSDVVERAGRLVCANKDFNTLLKELNLKKGESDPEKRDKLKSEMDGIVAKIYGLKLDELKYILDTFRLVKDPYKENVIKTFLELS